MDQYRVVIVERAKKPYEATMSFEEISSLVGHVVLMHLYDDKYALVDEDAEAKAVLPSRTVVIQDKSPVPIHILGTFVVIKQNKNKTNFVGLNEEELKEALYIFRSESVDATIFI